MGIDDRDYDYRPRGQAERRRGPYAGSDAPASRSSQRGRGNGYDDPRSSSGSRYERGGYDRRPRSDPSGSGRRPRSDWDDDGAMRRDRRPPDGYGRSDRSGRGPRPQRDDWETSARGRGAPRGPSPVDSGGRNRRPGAAVAPARGGGLWGDQPLNGSGARRGFDPRDPRARRGMPVEEDEETSGAAAFGKALMAILMALLIGVGAAYGYYVYSTPKIPTNISQPSASPTSGSGGSSLAPAGLVAQPSRLAIGLSDAAPAFVMAPAAPRA